MEAGISVVMGEVALSIEQLHVTFPERLIPAQKTICMLSKTYYSRRLPNSDFDQTGFHITWGGLKLSSREMVCAWAATSQNLRSCRL